MAEIWVIDDDRSVRFVLAEALREAGFVVRDFDNARAALNVLAHARPDAVFTDVRMPGRDGLRFLELLGEQQVEVPVVVMSAYTDVPSTATAFRHGAFEFLSKPFDLDAAVAIARRAASPKRIAATPTPVDLDAEAELVGETPAMREVFRAIGRVAQTDLGVLITGETGTGKELVARALHQHSRRARGPFVALNTAAIPAELLESELFGHEAGAFTGASRRQAGRFEQAAGGTLFLDEIGDMPADLQTRLLRVLADGEFYRVGGHAPVRVNVRVIAATHQALEERVRQGLFREDLFHRLNVIRIKLPALRERREDIPLLVKHFLQKSAQDLGVDMKQVSDEAIKALTALPYPGNVRQLENLCHWLTVMAPGQVIEPKDLPAEALRETAGAALDWTEALARSAQARLGRGENGILNDLTGEFERTLIRVALAHTGGRKIEAANLLGWGRNTLTRKIQELGMEAGGEE